MSDAGKQADEHDDSTESSDDTVDADVEGDGDGGHAAASPASAASDSDRAACGGSDLERGEVAPAPPSRGKSSAPNSAEHTDFVVDLLMMLVIVALLSGLSNL